MKNSETVMMQAIWRKALKQGELLIEFKSEGGAQRARMQLYNAVKKQKAGTDLTDIELVHAAEQMEIVWADDTHRVLKMRRKDDSDAMQGLLSALGMEKIADFVDPEAQASAERLLKEMDKLRDPTEAPGPGEHQDNPFYEKRG